MVVAIHRCMVQLNHADTTSWQACMLLDALSIISLVLSASECRRVSAAIMKQCRIPRDRRKCRAMHILSTVVSKRLPGLPNLTTEIQIASPCYTQRSSQAYNDVRGQMPGAVQQGAQQPPAQQVHEISGVSCPRCRKPPGSTARGREPGVLSAAIS